MRDRTVDLVIAILALVAIGAAAWQLSAASAGVVRESLEIDGTPVTIHRPAAPGPEPRPVVVIAHGFAGTRQLMQPFATTFARNGYVAVTFDFLGHGRNPNPLTGSITETDGATRALVDQTAHVAGRVRSLGDGRLALLGHSMASDIVVRAAQADPTVGAVVAVSMFSPAVTATSPGNLLVIVGGLEGGLKAEALRVVGEAAGGEAQPGVTYGDPAAGTGRRAAVSPGVEHVGVLYSRASMAEAMAWLDAAFGVRRAEPPGLDGRGPWILLLLAGVVALARPLSRALPVASPVPAGAGLGWRRIWPCLLVPAVATPLVLSVLPTRLLPILVGDYLAAHFCAYGLLTALCLRLARRGRPAPAVPVRPAAMAAGVAMVLAYVAVGIGWTLDAQVTSFVAIPARVPLILAMLAGTLPFFLADGWATGGAGAARGAAAVSKLAFLASLALAIALDFERLFFLIIIVPVILLFFLVFGLLSRWIGRRTGHPFVAGLADAAVFAWAIGVTFPMVTG